MSGAVIVPHALRGYAVPTERLAVEFLIPENLDAEVIAMIARSASDPHAIGCYPLDRTSARRVLSKLRITLTPMSSFAWFVEPKGRKP